MGEFRMPSLGAGMDAGRVLEWYVQPGDRVHRGDIVALVETDKANIEVEVFEDGVVAELLVEEGRKVPVGTPLARIESEVATGPEPAAVTSPAAPEEEAPAPEPAPAAATPDGDGKARSPVVSPLVRRLAKDTGVDLGRLRGTGRGGVVTRRDVERAADRCEGRPASASAGPRIPVGGTPASPYARRLAAERGVDPATLEGTGPRGAVVARDVPAPGAAAARDVPAPDAAVARDVPRPPAERLPGPDREAPTAATEDRGLAMRQAIARAMEQSNREIPHYYLGETVDVEQTMTWLTEVNADRAPPARLLPAVLVLKATALALRDYGDFNGYWIDGAFRPGDGIHLGVAINLRRGGLLAPAIRDADERSLDELMEALKDLVERTRSGGLLGSELTDPTITVSNLGDTGVESIQGVITPPQVALVGVGRITPRPWAVDGMLAVRRTLYLGLAGDHRASDGHRGGRFLRAIAANLTRPETL